MATPQFDDTYVARCGIPDAIVWCQQCALAYCRTVSYIYGCHVLSVAGKFLLGTGAAGTDYFCATCFLSSHKPEPKWLMSSDPATAWKRCTTVNLIGSRHRFPVDKGRRRLFTIGFFRLAQSIHSAKSHCLRSARGKKHWPSPIPGCRYLTASEAASIKLIKLHATLPNANMKTGGTNYGRRGQCQESQKSN